MATIDDLINLLGDGIGGAKHAPKIEEELHMDIGHTQEPTRDLIRYGIESRKYPIGSLPQYGYFLIDTEEELNQVVANLNQMLLGSG